MAVPAGTALRWCRLSYEAGCHCDKFTGRCARGFDHRACRATDGVELLPSPCREPAHQEKTRKPAEIPTFDSPTREDAIKSFLY